METGKLSKAKANFLRYMSFAKQIVIFHDLFPGKLRKLENIIKNMAQRTYMSLEIIEFTK